MRPCGAIDRGSTDRVCAADSFVVPTDWSAAVRGRDAPPQVLSDREQFQNVTAGIFEVDTPTAAPVVGLHVLERTRPTAVLNPFGLHPAKDRVEFLVRDFEREVMTIEVGGVVKVQGQRVVHLDRGKVGRRSLVPKDGKIVWFSSIATERPGRF